MAAFLDDQPAGVLAALAVLVCLLGFLPTARWDISQVNDTRATAAGAWHLLEHGSFQIDTAWPDVPWARPGVDGDWYVDRHPGAMVWTSMFYLPVPRSSSVASAATMPYGPAALSGAFATALGIGVMVLVLSRLVPRRTAFLAGLLLAFGTSNWTVSSQAAWNHGPTLLFLSLGLLAEQRRRGVWAGLAMAAAITVRPPVAVAPAALGLGRFARERDWRHLLSIGLLSMLGLAAMVAYYTVVYGEPLMRPTFVENFVTGAPTEGNRSWPVNAFLWLFAPGQGLFFLSPFLLFLLPGLRTAWRHAPDWVRWSALASLAYALFSTRATRYSGGGGFFGYRGPLETLTMAWPLLVLSWHHAVSKLPRWWEWTTAMAIGSVLVFAVGATVAAPHQRHDRNCFLERYVAPYRPQPEFFESRLRIAVDCVGMTEQEAREAISGGFGDDG